MEFIKPELFWLIPVLIALGQVIKSIRTINDAYIPIINVAVAVLFSLMWCLGNAQGAWFMAVYSGLAQGLLIGLTPTGAHQAYKQLIQK
jgi:hypothetical protein